MREVLVATVGTSIITNLAAVARCKSFSQWLEEQPESDRRPLEGCEQLLREAATDLEKDRVKQAAQELASLPGCPRVLGAEVASLTALLQEPPYGQLRRVLLLHSDTEHGLRAAAFLQELIPARFGLEAYRRRVTDLRDDLPGVFRTSGLRQLVRELARAVREHGARKLVFDATGGYKAQVAIAVAVGQVFGVPVVYRFERFPEVIEIPPLPLSLDEKELRPLLQQLEKGPITSEALRDFVGDPLTEANPRFARLAVVLSGPDDRGMFSLSPMGQLMWEAMQLGL